MLCSPCASFSRTSMRRLNGDKGRRQLAGLLLCLLRNRVLEEAAHHDKGCAPLAIAALVQTCKNGPCFQQAIA